MLFHDQSTELVGETIIYIYTRYIETLFFYWFSETDEDLDSESECLSSGSEWKVELNDSLAEEAVVDGNEGDEEKSDVFPFLQAPCGIRSPEKVTVYVSANTLPLSRVLNEDDKPNCIKNGGIFIKRSTQSEKSKSGRCYDIVHSCSYYGKLMSNIQNHLEGQHKMENDVKEILKLKKDKEMINDLNIKKQRGS